ncbi:hypothetical protein [Flavobacterium sp. RSP49]|uniref:hypothetical protein n=1 Tax=Flavobacterium sp. RSP49 TaxID=2497487 RepID=UPI001F47808E|nr:hypothetical protein [Flavobacterium sp. RSP49]
MSDKFKFFDPKDNMKKQQELKEKIYPLITGYTLKQIKNAFRYVEEEIKEEYIINLSD